MKLTIAVKQPKETETALHEEVDLRWDRIVYTLIGAVSLVAVVVFVFFPSGQNPEIVADDESARTDLPLFSTDSPTVPAHSAPNVEQGAVAVDRNDNTQQAATTDSGSMPNTDSEHMLKHQSQSENTNQYTDPVVAQPKPTAPPPTTPASSIATAKNMGSNSAGLFSDSTTTIHSDKIKRFSMARAVRNKEPVGALEDVTLSKDNVATVFVYSEALDLKDETLRYVWTLNGNEIADVKVPVWSARWRSHSSKYVTDSMRGDWKVELRDSAGDLLAMSEFQY